MTTIACNRREMAADSLVNIDGVGSDEFLSNKLHRIGRSIFGESGDDCNEVGLALEWLRAGAKPRTRPQLRAAVNGEFVLLELAPEGIFIWTASLTRDPVHEQLFAVGSGRKVALYCMKYLGMTPARAVEEAAKVDRCTRGPVKVEKLHARR